MSDALRAIGAGLAASVGWTASAIAAASSPVEPINFIQETPIGFWHRNCRRSIGCDASVVGCVASSRATHVSSHASWEVPLATASDKPAVLIASSRPGGNTAALVAAAFPVGSAAVFDIGALNIGPYAYDDAHSGDAFLPLVDTLLRHPTWVLATPLYWYTMSAQAKTFMDRLADLTTSRKELGSQLSGKVLAVLCSGTDPALPPAFDEPFRLTCEYLGMRYAGSCYGRFEGRQLVSPLGAAGEFATGLCDSAAVDRSGPEPAR